MIAFLLLREGMAPARAAKLPPQSKEERRLINCLYRRLIEDQLRYIEEGEFL